MADKQPDAEVKSAGTVVETVRSRCSLLFDRNLIAVALELKISNKWRQLGQANGLITSRSASE
jgi:hypothetical protein